MKTITVNTLIVASLGIGWLTLFIWLLVVSFKIRRINKREKAIAKVGENGDFVENLEKSLTEFLDLRNQLSDLESRQEMLSETLKRAVQRVGIVRFDAFEDIGGMLSFAVALLDDKANGVVISVINGRYESRTYAKPVRNGKSTYNLSIEEKQAIEEALVSGNTTDEIDENTNNKRQDKKSKLKVLSKA